MKDLPKFIGASVRRREDPALVSGAGSYVADLPLPGAATMVVVRSPHAHAKIMGIDRSRALERRGVIAVFTAEDIHPYLNAPLPVATGIPGFDELHVPDRFPLATDRVRHVGDPVAVIVAEDAYVASDAIEDVVVDYEPLEAVMTPERALEDGAPVLHETFGSNRAFVWRHDSGDVEAAFERAATRVTLDVTIQRLVPNAMEPRAVAARFDSRDGITMWSSTQFPHMLRGFVAKMLGIEAEAIHVIAPEVGGGFGAKANVYAEEALVPFLARHLRRPIRWAATRSEDYLCTSHGRDQKAKLSLAADASGRVLAVDLDLTMDCGGYFSRVTPIIPSLTGQMIPGVYEIPAVRVVATGVFTNKVMTEPYRGAGRPEATYFIERGMDRLASALGLDPVELRRRNFIPPERFPYELPTGLTYDSGDYSKSLDEALKRVGYRSLRAEQNRAREQGEGKLIGIGIACYVEICGFGPWELGAVTVDAEGRATVLTGTSPHGQGHETAWAQIAAETLQLPIDDITVLHGDTRVVPRGIGTFGSRSAPVGGAAVHQSAEHVREAAKEVAADLLEAATEDIAVRNGRFYVKGVPARSLGWKDVAQHAYSRDELARKLRDERSYEPKGETYPFGAHVAVVEIDPETGEIELRRFLTVDDCGKVLNPLLVEGQVHGGIAQGIGQALYEGAVYDEYGNLLTGSLMEYAVPRADQLPSYDTNRTETPSPLNALGVKGIGEAATIGSTPAVVNAVVDALSHLGVKSIDTPITPQKVWELLEEAQRRSKRS